MTIKHVNLMAALKSEISYALFPNEFNSLSQLAIITLDQEWTGNNGEIVFEIYSSGGKLSKTGYYAGKVIIELSRKNNKEIITGLEKIVKDYLLTILGWKDDSIIFYNKEQVIKEG